MAAGTGTREQLESARRAVEEADASPSEKAQMLMELAMGMQTRPRSPEDLRGAVSLYRVALELTEEQLLGARLRARLATALMALPGESALELEAAREELELALEVLGVSGGSEELAEAEMNLGLALQGLAGLNKVPISLSISAYQRSLRTFDRDRHPKEYAILQNNLATAFLSVSLSDGRGKMSEALAVQAFEEGLKAVNLIDHPSEYAMLQNNLGNALQYVSSSHRVENGYRALEAYGEALKVRNVRDTPESYANTICNRANCLASLPDDPEHPEAGNADNLAQAMSLYEEAAGIFSDLGLQEKKGMVLEAASALGAGFQLAG